MLPKLYNHKECFEQMCEALLHVIKSKLKISDDLKLATVEPTDNTGWF